MPKHICHISTTFNTKSGSARRTAFILHRSLEEGYAVTSVSGSSHDVDVAALPDGLIFHEVSSLRKYIDPARDLVALFEIWRLLRRLRPCLVHTHLAKAGVLGRLAARLAGVPKIVHTVHGPSFPPGSYIRRKVFMGLEKLCARFTDRTIFVGEELKRTYVEAGVCSDLSAIVIRSGRQPEDLEPKRLAPVEREELRCEIAGPAPERFVLLAIARIVPSKQLTETVEVLERLCADRLDVHLALAGAAFLEEERSYAAQLRRSIEVAGLDDRVTFLGHRSDVAQLIQVADAVIMTSAYEGLPNVALEAAAIGTPFAGYEVDGLGELFSESQLEWIVPQGRADQLAAAVLSIAEHPERARRVASQRSEEIRAEYALETMLDLKMRLYDELLVDDSS